MPDRHKKSVIFSVTGSWQKDGNCNTFQYFYHKLCEVATSILIPNFKHWDNQSPETHAAEGNNIRISKHRYTMNSATVRDQWLPSHKTEENSRTVHFAAHVQILCNRTQDQSNLVFAISTSRDHSFQYHCFDLSWLLPKNRDETTWKAIRLPPISGYRAVHSQFIYSCEVHCAPADVTRLRWNHLMYVFYTSTRHAMYA